MVVAGTVTRVAHADGTWAQSSRRVVATLLSADLAVHALARLSTSDDALLFLSTTATFLVELAPFEVLGWLLGWALYGYVLFETGHRLLPVVDEAAVDWRLRGFVTAATLASALAVERAAFRPAFTGSPLPPPPTGAAVAGLVAAVVAATVGFLMWYDGYPVPTDGLSAALVRSLLWSVAEAADDTGPSRGAEAALGLCVAAATVLVVCFLLGCLAVLVSLFFPIPEFLLLGWVVVGWSAWVGVRRTPRPPRSDGRAYPLSLAVQLVAMALVGDVVTGGNVVASALAMSPARLASAVLAVDGSTVAVLSLPVLFYAPEGMVALEHPPWHRRAVAYFLLLGVVVTLLGLAGDRPLFAASGAVPPLWALVYVAHERLAG